jgi:2'-5' RNA ligase
LGSGELEEDAPLTVRAFFGLPVPEPQREEVGRFIDACARIAPDFRWTPTENLHLTIRFVGRVTLELVDAVAGSLTERLPAAFELGLGTVGTFGRGSAVRVVWLGLVAGAEGVTALAAQVDDECVRAGLAREERPFHGHLTLARARDRNGAKLPELAPAPEIKPWPAGELILYSSRLARSGATYEVIRTLPLSR